MKEENIYKFDLSIPRRRYFSEDCGLFFCPECGAALVKGKCTVLIVAQSDTDEGEFMSNMTGSRFCNSCPVVVFDTDMIEQAAILGLKVREDSNLRYLVAGILNLEAIPKNKRHLEIGIEDNPMPLVQFLPDLNKATAKSVEKIGRNELCPCGSGKKYKKCCGK